MTDFSVEKMYQLLPGIWQRAQHDFAAEKWESKSQGKSHVIDWPRKFVGIKKAKRVVLVMMWEKKKEPLVTLLIECKL